MEWTHFVVWLLGIFIGSFSMTVWRNERKRREGNRHRQMWADAPEVARRLPPAMAEPPEAK
jgi:beta-lactamase regulating signal transducer with metallopeptidase domain